MTTDKQQQSIRESKSEEQTRSLYRIDAKLLIPGRGDPIADATLVYRNNDKDDQSVKTALPIATSTAIQHVGRRTELPARYACLAPSASVPVLMPGLWDCHVHYFGTHAGQQGALYDTPAALAGARLAKSLVATLNAGYTSVRELCGYGADLRPAIEEGWLPGPSIYPAVAMLSQTGGHGDAREKALCDVQAAIDDHRAMPMHLCDGTDGCIRAVRVMQRRGAQVIKLAASGGASTDGDDILVQQFSDGEMRAIVEEAARLKLPVAAHAHGKDGIMAALRAGCATIEHGSFLDAEAVELMKNKGAILVATRGAIVNNLLMKNITPEHRRKLGMLLGEHERSYRRAVQAGVRIALGSDIMTSSDANNFWTHGRNGQELELAVEAGLTPLQAIKAATANAPATLGPRAPRSGMLAEGFDADFISLDENPLENISLLKDASKIVNVWKNGKRVKKDGLPISIVGNLESL